EVSGKPTSLVGKASSPRSPLILKPFHIKGQAVGADGPDRFFRIVLRNIGIIGISVIEQINPLSERAPFVLRFVIRPERKQQNDSDCAADEKPGEFSTFAHEEDFWSIGVSDWILGSLVWSERNFIFLESVCRHFADTNVRVNKKFEQYRL